MPRRFTQADITKLLKAGAAAGAAAVCVAVQPDGTIVATFSYPDGAADRHGEWGERIRKLRQVRSFSQSNNNGDGLSAQERLARRVELRLQADRQERKKVREEHRRKDKEVRDLTSLGVDSRGMSDADRQAAHLKHMAQWKEEVARSPLNKRELAALAKLYELRGHQVKANEVRDAGPLTCRRLEARGYVVLELVKNRFVGWQITDRGVAAYQAGSLSTPN